MAKKYTPSKASTYRDNVSKLDSLGTDINEFIQAEGLNLIENILGEFVEQIHENINNSKGLVTTGKINDIEIKAEGNAVNIYMNPWLVYQSRGVNGSVNKPYNTPHSYSDKMPPVQVFKDWIKEKNIRLKDNETYYGEASPFKELTEEEQINKAAWGMATNVFKNGFKPRNLIPSYDTLVKKLGEEIANFNLQTIEQRADLINPSTRRNINPK